MHDLTTGCVSSSRLSLLAAVLASRACVQFPAEVDKVKTFIVVGAGPAGCVAALALACMPDVRVTLLERQTIAQLMAPRGSKYA